MLSIQPIAEGEIHVGIIGDANGDYYHLILLPGDNDDASWQSQIDWAKSIGGDLPDRVEQAMLFKHFRDQFKEDWYWSNEPHEDNAEYAWYQGFGGGYQDYGGYAYGKLSARAVRRLKI